MNVFIIAGNVGQDAEIQKINDKDFVSFSIAENQRVTDKSTGEISNITIWYNVLYHNAKLAQYLVKGTKVMVSGELKVDAYYSETSNKMKVSRNIYANQLQLLSPKQEEQTQQPTAESATAAPAAAPEVSAESEEPLPF